MSQRSEKEYDQIASEYYADRHVTSRNFDEATQHFVRDRGLLLPFAPSGMALDLGAGRGSASRLLDVDPCQVIQADRSREMLRLPTRERSLDRVMLDARYLPFSDRCFQIVCAFLFDPYFEPALFEGIGRVLVPGGAFVGTMPTKIWGEAIRARRGYRTDVARFVTNDGVHLDYRSVLASPDELSRDLVRSGFSDVKIEYAYLPPHVTAISPDIADAAVELGLPIDKLPILSVVVARI